MEHIIFELIPQPLRIELPENQNGKAKRRERREKERKEKTK